MPAISVLSSFNGLDTSDVAQELGTDLVVGFLYLVDAGRQKLILSMRSRGYFDCAKFAKSLGGGGHTNAAGCTIPVNFGDRHAYAHVEDVVQRYLEGR